MLAINAFKIQFNTNIEFIFSDYEVDVIPSPIRNVLDRLG
ncbi:14325_t:CDS:2 [Dentiscutata erythropus]|uniref:14325_t:CDS:1 n=1 Tax=Dentiscutata erythropus TaxID=1348616 RepID=A0A9N9FN27_9GLOM|nr:14325_t:CDS:2 [Dentiscutata erythropus]